MPETTPKPIAEYQGDTYCCDLKAVSEAIRLSGRPMMPVNIYFMAESGPLNINTALCLKPLGHCQQHYVPISRWEFHSGMIGHIVIMQLNYLYFGLVNHIQKFFFNSEDIDTGHEK